MSGRRKELMDIREVLLHLRAGASDSRIQRELAVDRRTVKKYRVWAVAQGLLEGPLPEFGELQRLVNATLNASLPPQNVSSVAAYGEVVRQLRQEGVEVAALWERLKERGFRGSYAAVWRFVQRLWRLVNESAEMARTAPAGRPASFGADALKENLTMLMVALNKAKPPTAKGIYIKKLTLSTTMGPGVVVDATSLPV